MGAAVKSPNTLCPPWSRRSLRTRRGVDPTMVMFPPRITENPMGMRSRDDGIPVFRAIRTTRGRKRAAAPTFWMKAENTPAVRDMKRIRRFSSRPAARRMGWISRFRTPERSTPWPRIMTAMTARTALPERPEKASRGSISPSHGRRTMTRMAMTSTRTRFVTKRRTVIPRTDSTRAMSKVMGKNLFPV